MQQNKFNVIVAVNKTQQSLLSKEFNNVEFIYLEGYNISYTKTKFLFALKILLQAPKILFKIYAEHKWLKKTITEKEIDLVISDNRFGLFSKKISCVFITHQLTIKAPLQWFEKIIQKINYFFINQYQQCWVPDIEKENNIAGVLSHPKHLPLTPVHYIGILSRFKKEKKVEIKYDLCILLSGPEPQRTILEVRLLCQIQNQTHLKIIFIRGLPTLNDTLKINGVECYNHLSQQELETIINCCDTVIARSGYTTVMELLSLQKKSILIPTPGQTEQEYLAKYLQEKKYCLSYSQEFFFLDKAITESYAFNYQLNKEFIFNDKKIIELVNNFLN